jgi:hypothetical protein
MTSFRSLHCKISARTVVDWHVIELVNLLVGQSDPHCWARRFFDLKSISSDAYRQVRQSLSAPNCMVALPCSKAVNNSLASLRLALRMDSVSIEEWGLTPAMRP